MSAETELKKGNFVVCQCINCKKTVWPPADFCNRCYDKTVIKKGPSEGKIIEFSKNEQCYFCLVEFEKEVKIIGKITSGVPKEGQKVKIKKCGIKDENYFFEFYLI